MNTDDEQFDFISGRFERLNDKRRQQQNGEAHARSRDPETSQEAAEFMRGDAANHGEREILRVLRAHESGLTTHEISELSGIPYWSTTPRMAPLRRKGLVEDSGLRRQAEGSGVRCIVWRAVR